MAHWTIRLVSTASCEKIFLISNTAKTKTTALQALQEDLNSQMSLIANHLFKTFAGWHHKGHLIVKKLASVLTVHQYE